MKRIFLFVVAALLLCDPAYSQVSGTRRILSWPSITGTDAVADTTTMVLIDGTTIGTRATTLTNLGTALLSTQSLVNSLTIKGTGLSISGTSGALTLTGSALTSGTSGSASIFTLTFGSGTLTGAQTTTGVLTLSNLGVGTAATTTAALTLNTTVSGRIGASFISAAGQTQPWMEFKDSGATQLMYFDPVYGLQIRHASTTNRITVGTSGSVSWALNSSGTSSYQQMWNTAGIAFASGAGITATSPSINSQTGGILQITDTNYARSTLATGAFAVGYRALTTSSQLTVTDGSVSGSGAITLTLPDATTLTGRMVVIPNVGASTVVVSGLTTTQVINTTQSTSILTGSTFIGISTGTTWIGQRVSQ